MSIFHVFFSPYSEEYLAHKKTYKPLIHERDSTNLALIVNFNKKVQIQFEGNEEMLELSNKLVNDYKRNTIHFDNKKSTYNKIKATLAKAFSFRGRNSFRFWLAYCGIAIALFFFSVKSLYNDILFGSTYKFHFISLTGIVVSSFWIIHFTFLTQKDFNNDKYFAILLVSGIFSSFFTYFLTKNFTYKDDLILNQLSLIERIKTIHYPLVAAKAKYAEKYKDQLHNDTTVNEDVDNFQNDIKTSLEL